VSKQWQPRIIVNHQSTKLNADDDCHQIVILIVHATFNIEGGYSQDPESSKLSDRYAFTNFAPYLSHRDK
jgi:hypothetical protein